MAGIGPTQNRNVLPEQSTHKQSKFSYTSYVLREKEETKQFTICSRPNMERPQHDGDDVVVAGVHGGRRQPL
jgi:hypothetical protein